MTRLAKLNARLLSGGKLTFAEFQRLLEAYGFALMRVSGSHHIYIRQGIRDQLSIQPAGAEAKAYQLRQFVRILQDNGLTLDGHE